VMNVYQDLIETRIIHVAVRMGFLMIVVYVVLVIIPSALHV